MTQYIVFIYIILVLFSIIYIKYGGEISEKEKFFLVILSGSNKYITKFRIKEALKLYKKNIEIVICGKEMANYMKEELEYAGINKFYIQNLSTNTDEDAKFLLKEIPKIKNSKIILVSSLSHQRRSFHTFLKYFKEHQIVNRPATSEFLSLYSPLLPTGWAAAVLNIYKDFRYNKQII